MIKLVLSLCLILTNVQAIANVDLSSKSRVVSIAPHLVQYSHRVATKATWYCWPFSPYFSPCHYKYSWRGLYAAAGSSLRIGNWRGRYVTVFAPNGRYVRVRLVDWCRCGGIDLYGIAFKRLYTNFIQKGTSSVVVKW